MAPTRPMAPSAASRATTSSQNSAGPTRATAVGSWSTSPSRVSSDPAGWNGFDAELPLIGDDPGRQVDDHGTDGHPVDHLSGGRYRGITSGDLRGADDHVGLATYGASASCRARVRSAPGFLAYTPSLWSATPGMCAKSAPSDATSSAAAAPTPRTTISAGFTVPAAVMDGGKSLSMVLALALALAAMRTAL